MINFAKKKSLKLFNNLELNVSKHRVLKLFQIKFISDSNSNIRYVKDKIPEKFLEKDTSLRNQPQIYRNNTDASFFYRLLYLQIV